MFVTASVPPYPSAASIRPPAYVGARLTEAVASALNIVKLSPARLVAVYEMAEGKDHGMNNDQRLVMAVTAGSEGDMCWTWSDGKVPMELYQRGFQEIDALYEAQNPQP